MKRAAFAAIASVALLLSGAEARATPFSEDNPRPAKPREPEIPDTDEPPDERIGWQGGFRTGAAFPIGSASGEPGDGMPQWVAWQLPIHMEVGYKPLPWLWVGPYLVLGFGDTNGALLRSCKSCDAKT